MFIYYFNKIRISREVVQVYYNSDDTSSDTYISTKELVNKKIKFCINRIQQATDTQVPKCIPYVHQIGR